MKTSEEVYLGGGISYLVVRGRVSENALDVGHKVSDSCIGLLLELLCYAAQPHRSRDHSEEIWRLTCESHSDFTEPRRATEQHEQNQD